MRIKTFEIRIDPAFREYDEREVNEFLRTVRVTRLNSGCLRARNSWTLIAVYDEQSVAPDAERAVQIGELPPRGSDLTPHECERYEALRMWRGDRAAALGRKPFVIASDRDLINVARSEISTPEDLLAITGFGPRRAERYGEEIVAVLDSVAQTLPCELP